MNNRQGERSQASNQESHVTCQWSFTIQRPIGQRDETKTLQPKGRIQQKRKRKKRTGTNPRRQGDHNTATRTECGAPRPPLIPRDPEPSFPGSLSSEPLLHRKAPFLKPAPRRRKDHLLAPRGGVKGEDFAVQCALGAEEERDPTVVGAEADGGRHRGVAGQRQPRRLLVVQNKWLVGKSHRRGVVVVARFLVLRLRLQRSRRLHLERRRSDQEKESRGERREARSERRGRPLSSPLGFF